MANFGGFLQALGQSFGGYAQDQQTRFAKQQALQQAALAQRSGDDAHLNAVLERTTNYPFAGSGGGPVGADGLPTGSVDVAGYGSIDPYGKFRTSLMMDRVKKQQDTDEAIRKAQMTGEIDKNTTEADKNRRDVGTPRLGDANYADALSEVESKKALATLPTQVRLEVLRGNISLGNALAEQKARFGNEVTLQGNAQQFQQGQQGRQFQFDADKAAREMTGHFVNESALANQRAQGTISGKLFAPPPMTLAPSNAVAPTTTSRLTPEQVVRAARDPLYRQFLESQGYTLGGKP